MKIKRYQYAIRKHMEGILQFPNDMPGWQVERVLHMSEGSYSPISTVLWKRPVPRDEIIYHDLEEKRLERNFREEQKKWRKQFEDAARKLLDQITEMYSKEPALGGLEDEWNDLADAIGYPEEKDEKDDTL